MNGQQAMIWIQVGGAMINLVVTSFERLKEMLAASGATEAEQAAALDRVHALYQDRIAQEQAIVDAANDAGPGAV